MKKISLILLAVFLTVSPVFTQDINISGEVKTGYYIEQEKIGDLDSRNYNAMRNNDGDSGFGEGRLRLDFNVGYENIGLCLRFQVEVGEGGSFNPAFNYAYAYGNMFNDQFTISAGILGNSPWGTGGPNIRKELETSEAVVRNPNNGDITAQTYGLMGIRFEYKPLFLPGLNVGFALNQPDYTNIKSPSEQSFGELLGETVVGVSYENEYFAVGVGYRFDGEMDEMPGPKSNEGGRLAYRLEERVLSKLAQGLQISLNGYYFGLGMEQFEQNIGSVSNPIMIKMGGGEYFINWLYLLWDHTNFIAKFDAGFTMFESRFNQALTPWLRQDYQLLEIMPAFYFKFLNNVLQVGVGLGLGIEFGNGTTFKDTERILNSKGTQNNFYQYFYVEPQVRLNLNSNAYIALVYNYTNKYAHPEINVYSADQKMKPADMSDRHWINLRAVYSF